VNFWSFDMDEFFPNAVKFRDFVTRNLDDKHQSVSFDCNTSFVFIRTYNSRISQNQDIF